VTDSRAVEICRRQEQLASDRANFNSLWQQVAERILPGEASFTTQRTPGEARNEKVYDATASLALRKYGAIIESLSMPRTTEWHQLQPEEESLADNHAVKSYLEEVNKGLFRRRYAPAANFTAQIGSVNLGLGAFGNAPLFVDEIPGFGRRYKAIPLAELYFCENHAGIVDTAYRCFKLSARQAEKQFGDKLPEQIKTALSKNPDQLFTFIHCVRPVDETEAKKVPRGAQYLSLYASQDYKQIVREGHYYSFPYPVARDVSAAGEVYARSPAMWVLPGIKMLNEMKRTVIRAGQKAVDPPLLLTDEGALQGFSLRPGSLNPGSMSDQGVPLVQALESRANLNMGVELMQEEQRIINDSFYISLLQIVTESPQMTATEVLQRAQEQGMLLGPVSGRQQEFAGQLIERELDMDARAGLLPPMPPELAEAGGRYKIVYDNPLTRIQRAGAAVGILRTFEGLAPLAELHPEVFDVFDLDETARTLAEANGIPNKLSRPPEQVEQIREQRNKQQAAAAAVEAAPKLAGAAKDVGLAAA